MLAAMGQSLEVFRLNMYILGGAIAFVLIAGAVILAVWVTIRSLLWRREMRRAARQARQARLGPDGKPYPPSASGLCDRCGRAFDRVYHLPGGGRRCQGCYEMDHPEKGLP